MVDAADPPLSAAKRAVRPLEALNFFMADTQPGIGPFLGVFLQQRGWTTGNVGLVMTIGGILTVLASALIWVSQSFWVIAGSQIATAVAGAAICPAMAGITLGIARQRGFNRQNGRNQAYNHAGSMVGAALSEYLGWKFGFAAIFWLASGFGALSIVATLMIPRDAIDDGAARGLESKDGKEAHGQAKGWRVLIESEPLLVLAACLALFHLCNAAMLPLYGLAVVAAHKGNPASFVATTIVAQAVMIVAALVAMRMAEKSGYRWVLLITFVALPIRGLVAGTLIEQWGVFPVQALDGIGAGLQSVAVPGLVARILSGTGRVSVGQGAVMTVQGLGAALSPAIGGFIAQHLGYPAAFFILGSFALGSLALWLVFALLLKPACASPADSYADAIGRAPDATAA